jgi:hypothetical protein
VQPPLIRLQDVLDDCETQARGSSALVKAGTALNHPLELTRLDPFAIIFDDKEQPIVGDGDADTFRSMSGSVLDQIA